MKEPSDKNIYVVLDVETTRNCKIEGHSASAFHPDNRVVLTGWRCSHWEEGGEVCTLSGSPKFYNPTITGAQFKLFVGHNIGFDIHHALKNDSLSQEFLGTVGLWDTQLAEYLLTAQRTIMASLDDLSEKYGGTKKDTKVSDIFKTGAGADAVPMTLLAPYLKDDVLNTERVFIEQFKAAQRLNMVPLVVSQMDALAATIEMTYNGLALDFNVLIAGVKRVGEEVEKLEREIKAGANLLGVPDSTSFNVDSTKQLSLALFGGTMKRKVTKRDGEYKNGKPKFKAVEEERVFHGAGLKPTGPKNSKGDYPTDDKALNALLDQTLSGVTRSFIEAVLAYREKSKQLGTYWTPLVKLLMPDGRIHHRLNHCVARTGRLSSSDPNLQNVTNGEVKTAFVSRWGKDGVLIEADFKQLEMVELAELSKDPQLIKDIEDGVDMHDALFKSMYGRPMKPEERKKFKRCSFALIYGAGYKGIAEQGGISEADAKRFIETFYARYPGVRAWHDGMMEWAKRLRVNNGLKDKDTGLPMGEATLISATGRRYWFREYPTPWGKVGFSPTELKNYFVQGGATGDKVPLCLGKLYRVLRNHPTLKDKCLMVNTVHDSVLFDCHRSVLQEALALIKKTMESTPQYFEETFGVKMRLPLKVSLSYGPNWLDQKEADPKDFEWKEAA